MYSIQRGQQLLDQMKVNNGQACVSSGAFSSLPTEVIVQIFQKMVNFKDFCSLALSCKFFYLIASQNPQAASLSELVPSYFKHHANASLHHLPFWEQVELATQIENKLVSSKTLEPIFKKTLLLDNSNFFFPFITTIIGDYLVLASLSLPEYGAVYVYNFKKDSPPFVFHLDDCSIPLCMAIHAPSPLLVTATYSGFKIWDFESLLKLENHKDALLLEKKDPPSYSEFNPSTGTLEDKNSPVIAVSNHLLGVGYANHVLILDSHRLSELPLHIDFKNVIQIEFFEDYLLLVSDNQIAMWAYSAILAALEQQTEEKTLSLESAIFTYTLNACSYYGESIKIAFSKIHREKIVIAYQKGYFTDNSYFQSYFQIGEVLNWKTNQKIRPLAYEPNVSRTSEFESMDFQDNFVFTASNYLCKWDLDHTQSPFQQSWHTTYCLSGRASKVYSIGVHTLFVLPRCLLIQKTKVFSTKVEKDATLLPLPNPEVGSSLRVLTFDLKGKYLITIIKDYKTPPVVTLSKRIPPSSTSTTYLPHLIQSKMSKFFLFYVGRNLSFFCRHLCLHVRG